MTPTEELFMEVLAGRYRTGETLWTFGSRLAIRQAANRLEERGLIWLMGGQVENTFRAGLTEKGIAEVISPTYKTPFKCKPRKKR